MKYIKHDNKFYKEVDLTTLDKKELITQAVEIDPKVIERWRCHPVYVDKYLRWNQYWYGNTMLLNTPWPSGSGAISFAAKLNTVDKADLVSMCSKL